MSTLGLTFALVAALGLLGIVINQLQARVALIEVALNEGLAPGHERIGVGAGLRTDNAGVVDTSTLTEGVHIFVSRGCIACQRLVSELHESVPNLATSLHLRYVDRPRPEGRQAAARAGVELHANEQSLARTVGADPLPYTIARGAHGLVARGVTPNAASVITVARDAGHRGSR